jgi:hypothetical protein
VQRDEQIGRGIPADYALKTSKPDWYRFNKNSRRSVWVKRQTSKHHRRMAKLHMEDAQPRNRYHGWTD